MSSECVKQALGWDCIAGTIGSMVACATGNCWLGTEVCLIMGGSGNACCTAAYACAHNQENIREQTHQGRGSGAPGTEEDSFAYQTVPDIGNSAGSVDSEASGDTGNSKGTDKEAAHNPATFWENQNNGTSNEPEKLAGEIIREGNTPP